MIYGYRKEFGEKLQQLIPPQAVTQEDGKLIAERLKIDYMRIAANSFAHALQDVPRSEEELRDALYVFGRVTHEMLEKRLENLQAIELLRVNTSLPSPVFVKAGA